MSETVAKPVNTARTSYTPIPDAKQKGEEYVALPKGRSEGVLTASTRQTILVDAETLYGLWKNEAGFPLWQEKVVSVIPLGDGKSHWVMGDPSDPDGKRVEFDSEITEDVPGEAIAWQSREGSDVEQRGRVEFKTRRDGRGTVVTLEQSFVIGKLANAAASMVQRGPEQTVVEDLRHFKQMAEAGEIPSAVGNPHGPRGISGKAKGWLYGENNTTPPGTSVDGAGEGKANQ